MINTSNHKMNNIQDEVWKKIVVGNFENRNLSDKEVYYQKLK